MFKEFTFSVKNRKQFFIYVQVKPVGTSERYSHQNEDGSFTFGYIAEDGSFREETRGTDCITRGKYGYIDPDGKRREFTYTSGKKKVFFTNTTELVLLQFTRSDF